ncbi:hypothetical protein RB597_006445 [Gaeumannomyces tritici]
MSNLSPDACSRGSDTNSLPIAGQHKPPHRLDHGEAIAPVTGPEDNTNQDATDASAAQQQQQQQQRPLSDHLAPPPEDSTGIHSLPAELLTEICEFLIAKDDRVRTEPGDCRRGPDASAMRPLLALCLTSRRFASAARHTLYKTVSFYAPSRTITPSRRAPPPPVTREGKAKARAEAKAKAKAEAEVARLSVQGQRSLVLFLRSLLENASLQPLVCHLDCLVSLQGYIDPDTPRKPQPNGQLVQEFWEDVRRGVRVQRRADLHVLRLAGLIKPTPSWQRSGSGGQDGSPLTQPPATELYVGGRIYVALLCLCPRLKSTSFAVPVQAAAMNPAMEHPGSLANPYQELSGILEQALNSEDINPSLLCNLETVAVARQSVASSGSQGGRQTAGRIGCGLLTSLTRLPSVRTVELDRLRICLPPNLDVDGVESLRVGGLFTSADMVSIFSSPALKHLHLRVYGRNGVALAKDTETGVLSRAVPLAAASLITLDMGLPEVSSPWRHPHGNGPHRQASSTLRWLLGWDAPGRIRCLPSLRNLRELRIDAALLLGDASFALPANLGRMLPAGLERLYIREAHGMHPNRELLAGYWSTSHQSYRHWMEGCLLRIAATCTSQLRSLREVRFVRSPDQPEWELAVVSNAFRDVNVKFI